MFPCPGGCSNAWQKISRENRKQKSSRKKHDATIDKRSDAHWKSPGPGRNNPEDVLFWLSFCDLQVFAQFGDVPEVHTINQMSDKNEKVKYNLFNLYGCFGEPTEKRIFSYRGM